MTLAIVRKVIMCSFYISLLCHYRNRDSFLTRGLEFTLTNNSLSPSPQFQWHRTWVEIGHFLDHGIPIRVWQSELKSVNQGSHENCLFKIADIAPNAASGAGTEWNEVWLKGFAFFSQPSLWLVGGIVFEHRLLMVHYVGGNAD